MVEQNSSLSVNPGSGKSTVTNAGQAPKPRKKKHKLWLIPVILLIILLLPVVLVFALFYDGSVHHLDIEKGLTNEKMYEQVIVDSLKNAKEEKKVDIAITQKHLNQLLYNAMSKADPGIKQFIPQVDVKINGDRYDFYFNVDLSFFKTKIILKTQLAKETRDGVPTFVFAIKDVKLCRLGGMTSLAISLLKNFVSEESLEELFKGHLSIKIDFKKREVTYRQEDLINDMKNLISAEEEISKLYYTIISDLTDNTDVFDFTFKDGLHGVIKLDQLMENEYVGGNYNLDLSKHLTKIVGKLQDMVNNKLIKCESNDMKQMHDFLFHGYGYSNSTDTYINNFSDKEALQTDYLDGCDYDKYKGVGIVKAPLLNETMKDSDHLKHFELPIAPSSLTDGIVLSYLTEQDLNNYLKSLNIVGSAYLVSATNTKDETSLAYITMDNFYANFLKNNNGEDEIDLVVGINVNGCQTNVTFQTVYQSDDTEPLKMTFKADAIKYGNINVSEPLRESLFKMIKSALNAALEGEAKDAISIDEDEQTISLNFGFNDIVSDVIETLNTFLPGSSAKARTNFKKGLDRTDSQIEICLVTGAGA